MKLIDSLIEKKSNNLNFIRLMAAISVTFGHCFAMIHGSPYEILGGIHSAAFGFYPVAIFFGLSGFLITQSFFRQPAWRKFMRARLLRLVPGYLFANFVTVLIIVYLIKDDYSLIATKEFFLHILGGSYAERFTFPNVFAHLHYNSTNGSLWTLPYEFQMYMAVLFLGLTKVLNHRKIFALLCLIMAAVAFFQIERVYDIIFTLLMQIRRYEGTYFSLSMSFALGMLAYLYREKIRISVPLALVILVGSFFTPGWFLKNLAWLYFVFSFGYHPRYYLPRLHFKNDLSYGIYILSWPIQQCVLHFKLTSNPWVMFFYSMIGILPLAYISWKFVEEPSLKFKSKGFVSRHDPPGGISNSYVETR